MEPSTAALLRRRILAEKLSALVIPLLLGNPAVIGNAIVLWSFLRDWTPSSQPGDLADLDDVDGTDRTASFKERDSSRALGRSLVYSALETPTDT